MKYFSIRGKSIILEEDKKYLDFYLEETKQIISEIDFDALLGSIEKGDTECDEKFRRFLSHLQRWVVEAPRKRGYRQMRKDGFTVLSDEQFFDEEGGEEIIDNLENTGKLAKYLLKELF